MNLQKELEGFKKRIEKKGVRVLAASVCVDTNPKGAEELNTAATGFSEMIDEMAIVMLAGARGLKVVPK